MAFNINDYEPVEVRLAKFWEKFPEGRVYTGGCHTLMRK